MHYVYLLRSKVDKSLYIGYTLNIKTRLERHNNKAVVSTKNKVPWDLVYFEGFIDSSDAKRRETYLKSGWGRRTLKNILSRSLSF